MSTIAVAIHDVEPATFDRCALIRDWLADHGIDRVTLLVVPAPDLHPFFQRRPDLADWLLDCRDNGDAIAQQGFRRDLRRAGRSSTASTRSPRTRASRRAAACSSSPGIEPRGFVAPSYAYTPALRRELGQHVRLVGDGAAVRAPRRGQRGRARPLAARSPLALRAGALIAGRLLRLDLHPGDFDKTRHVLALEAVLRSARRTAVTYDDLCPSPPSAAHSGGVAAPV